MTNSVLTWFKGLSEGWRTITVLSGFVVTVAITAVAIDHFKTKVSDASAVLVFLQKAKIENDKKNHITDSIQTVRHLEINTHLNNISDSLRNEYINQNIFQTNYSHFVSSKTGSVSEWMKYMNGMQISIVQDPYIPNKSLEEVKPSYKIHIIPLNKNDTINRKAGAK